MKMLRVAFVLVFGAGLCAPLSWAGPASESLASGSWASFRVLASPDALKGAPVPTAVAGTRVVLGRSQPPRTGVGKITGGINGRPVRLTIDRRAGTITGGVNLTPVRLKIDYGARTLEGGANRTPYRLSFEENEDGVFYHGAANHSRIGLAVHYGAGTVSGYANNSRFDVTYDAATGEVTGTANKAPVRLKYDGVTGKITGGLNRRTCRITLEGMDVREFLRYLFLFCRPLTPDPR